MNPFRCSTLRKYISVSSFSCTYVFICLPSPLRSTVAHCIFQCYTQKFSFSLHKNFLCFSFGSTFWKFLKEFPELEICRWVLCTNRNKMYTIWYFYLFIRSPPYHVFLFTFSIRVFFGFLLILLNFSSVSGKISYPLKCNHVCDQLNQVCQYNQHHSWGILHIPTFPTYSAV